MDAAHIHRWAATELKINNRAKGTARTSVVISFKKEDVHPKCNPSWTSGKQWSCSESILQRAEHNTGFCTGNVAKGSVRLAKSRSIAFSEISNSESYVSETVRPFPSEVTKMIIAGDRCCFCRGICQIFQGLQDLLLYPLRGLKVLLTV